MAARKLAPVPAPSPRRAAQAPAPRVMATQHDIPVTKRPVGRPPAAKAPPMPATGRGVAPAPIPVSARGPAPAPMAGGISKADADTIRAELAAAKSELEKLRAVVAKTQAKTRTREEILEGGELGIAADDWRLPYQAYAAAGNDMTLHGFGYSKGGQIEPEPTLVSFMTCIPRTDDIGGKGTAARNGGRLALYYQLREDGMGYEGAPEYVTETELAALYPQAEEG